MTKQTLPVYAMNAVGPSLDVTLQVNFEVTGQAYAVPSFIVPPGASVTLYPAGKNGLNTNPCYVATDPESLGGSYSSTLPAGQDVSLPLTVDNTGNIWVSGTAGNGVTVKVQKSQIG